MRIIPVLDIRRGQAVRALAGDRDHYGPLRSVLHEGTDPVELARAGRDRWGCLDLYLADLDAILGEAPPDFELYRNLGKLGLTLWVDSGVRKINDVPDLINAGVERVIVGLETVSGPETVAAMVDRFGPDRLVFSLDLKNAKPMVPASSAWQTDRPDKIASMVIDIGIIRLIILDLARVGTGGGVGWIPENRTTDVEWFIGGGINDIEQIRTLERAGFAGVLVGSALHDGRIE